MKKFAIKRLYSYFETTSQEIKDDIFDEKIAAFDEELRALLEKYDLRYICDDTRFITAQQMSVQKCEQCNNLMLNRDKNPMRFNKEDLWIDLDTDYNFIIWDGGSYEGRELCMDCLPIGHRWGYSA